MSAAIALVALTAAGAAILISRSRASGMLDAARSVVTVDELVRIAANLEHHSVDWRTDGRAVEAVATVAMKLSDANWGVGISVLGHAEIATAKLIEWSEASLRKLSSLPPHERNGLWGVLVRVRLVDDIAIRQRVFVATRSWVDSGEWDDGELIALARRLRQHGVDREWVGSLFVGASASVRMAIKKVLEE